MGSQAGSLQEVDGSRLAHDEDLREPLVRRQGSQVSMRVARGSVRDPWGLSLWAFRGARTVRGRAASSEVPGAGRAGLAV